MNRKAIIISLLFIAAILISGCVEEGSVVVNYNPAELSSPSDNNITVTEIIKEKGWIGTTTLITGKVVEIRFTSSKDIIVFEDGYIIAGSSAESYTWKIGEKHQIRIFDSQIKNVKIIEDSDEK